jgi:L-fuconate dehydratase
MSRITAVRTYDVRFPTSRTLDGSDAMHPDPDYSAAYVVLETDGGDGIDGHGFAFTTGRGTEVQVAAIQALAPLVIGRDVAELAATMGAFWRELASDSQLRWLGPEKGVIHMATAAVVNAAWDLHAKTAGVPLWKLLVDLPPERLVDLVDFRYLTDALDRDRALDLLRDRAAGKADRESRLRTTGLRAYTTSAGWLGYDDDKVTMLLRQAVADGFRHVKLKVGADLDSDLHRVRLARSVVGDNITLMLDANQRWSVPEAITAMERLGEVQPWWIEEPTSPDDVLGHAAIAAKVAPIAVATGEHVQNRVMFKQYFQARALDICQIDACRLGGVNEVVAVLLLAAHFDIPVCPHAGGVGLCELVNHLALVDAIAIGGDRQDRVVEWVDHLHEHFVDPAVVRDAHYVVPTQPGYSSQMRTSSIDRYLFPTGPVWRATS